MFMATPWCGRFGVPGLAEGTPKGRLKVTKVFQRSQRGLEMVIRKQIFVYGQKPVDP